MRRIGLVLCLALELATAGSAAIRGAEAAEPADRSSAQSEEPKIELRPTYGPGGSTRPAEVIAGESLHVMATVSNVGVAPSGKLEFVLEGDLVDAAGTVTELARQPAAGQSYLGGASFVTFLRFPIARNSASGTYYLRVRARDAQGTQRAAETLAFVVKPSTTFGAANLQLFQGKKADCPAGGVFPVGADLIGNYTIVGFDTEEDRASVRFGFDVLDENGKVVSPPHPGYTWEEHLTSELDRARVANGLPAHFYLGLHRPGKFRLRLELKDHIGNQSAVYEIPIIVCPSP